MVCLFLLSLLGIFACLAVIVAFNVMVLPDLPQDWIQKTASGKPIAGSDMLVTKGIFYSFAELLVGFVAIGYYFFVCGGKTPRVKVGRALVTPVALVAVAGALWLVATGNLWLLNHGYLRNPKKPSSVTGAVSPPTMLDGALYILLELVFGITAAGLCILLYHCASEDVAKLWAINHQFDIYDENAAEKKG